MIKRFSRNNYNQYYNAFQLGFLFVGEEILEALHYFNAYDPAADEYITRRVFWLVFTTASFVSFLLLISITCISFLIGA